MMRPVIGKLGLCALLVVCALAACDGGGSGAPLEGAATTSQAVVLPPPPQLQLRVRTPACGGNGVEDELEVQNTGTTPVRLSDLSIRLWVDDTSGIPLEPWVLTGGQVTGAGVVHEAWGVFASAQHFGPACGDGPDHQADWEVTVSTLDPAVLPPGATWSGLRSVVSLLLDLPFRPGPSEWYSGCVAGSAYQSTSRFALYAGGKLVTSSTGVPPSCRAPHGTQTLGNHVASGQGDVPVVGPVPPAMPMTVGISLPLTHQAELGTFIEQLYDPASPQFGQYLTPAQFGAAYGASASDYQALVDYAGAHGLTVAKTYGNSSFLSVSGTAAQIESAFYVTLDVYQRPDGTTYHAPANEPSLDVTAPVLHLSGLENATEPQAADARGGTGLGYCSPSGLASDRVQSYGGHDLSSIFFPCNAALPTPLDGTGQTIGLLERAPMYAADLTDYFTPSQFGFGGYSPIPTVTVELVAPPSPPTPLPQPALVTPCVNPPVVNGSPVTGSTLPQPTCMQSALQSTGLTPTDGTAPVMSPALYDSANEDETALDVEMVAAMAPGATILLYEQPEYIDDSTGHSINNFDGDSVLERMADDDTAGTISSSWFWQYHAGYNPASANVFLQLAAQGQSFFEASGDNGAFVPQAPNPHMPEPAADTALITLVGGTHLVTTGSAATPPGIQYASETTWNDPSGRTNGTCVNTYPYLNAQGQLASCHSISSGGIATGYTATNSDGTRATFPTLPLPSYQSALPTAYGSTPIAANGQLSSTVRMVPDVSLPADALTAFFAHYVESSPMTVTYNLPGGGTATVTNPSQFQVFGPLLQPCFGGTSAASPLWAAVVALMNQNAALHGKPRVGFANPLLYQLARASGASYAANFHDVNDGSNNAYPRNPAVPAVVYTAQAGYDLTTGLGSPSCGLLGLPCVTCGGGSACIQLDTDPGNCGACGHVCAGACKGGACQPASLASIVGYSGGVASDGASVFFTDTGNDQGSEGQALTGLVRSVGVTGGNVTSLATGLNEPGPLTLDPAHAVVLYGDQGLIDNSLFDVPKGGGASTKLAQPTSPGTGDPLVLDMAVDASNVYWLSQFIVYQTPRNGGATQVLFTTHGAPSLRSITSDASNVYWIGSDDSGADLVGTIWSTPIGGGPISVVVSGITPSVGVGHILAVQGANLYFAQSQTSGSLTTGDVDTVPVGGGAVTLLARNGAGLPVALTADATNLYWIFGSSTSALGSATGLVQTVPLGGGATLPLASGPVGVTIAVDASNVYWSTSGNAGAGTVGHVWSVPK